MIMNINTDALLQKLLGKKYSFMTEYMKNGVSLEDALKEYELKEARLKEVRRERAHQRYLEKKYREMYGDEDFANDFIPEEVDEDDYYAELYDEDEGVEADVYDYIPLEEEHPSRDSLNEAGRQLQEINYGQLEQIALTVLKRSLYYCPIDTGNLRDSVRLIRAGQGFIIKYFADYAPYVHEIDYKHDSPTQKKFLEDAAYETFNNIRVTMPNVKLPEVRILYAPLTLFINVDTTQGFELFDDTWLDGDEHKSGPFEMMDNFLNQNPEYLGDLLENFEDLGRNMKLSEDVADMFMMLAFARYGDRYKKGR